MPRADSPASSPPISSRRWCSEWSCRYSKDNITDHRIRKDYEAPERGASDTEALIKTLTGSVAELQRQVSFLTEQVTRQQSVPPPNAALPRSGPSGPTHPGSFGTPHGSVPPPGAPPSHTPAHAQPSASAGPGPAPSAGHISAPPPVQRGVPPNIEDIFLSALSNQTTASTLSVLQEYSPLIEDILPLSPSGGPMLSQAVLLTLLHRVCSSSILVSLSSHPSSLHAQSPSSPTTTGHRWPRTSTDSRSPSLCPRSDPSTQSSPRPSPGKSAQQRTSTLVLPISRRSIPAPFPSSRTPLSASSSRCPLVLVLRLILLVACATCLTSSRTSRSKACTLAYTNMWR